jgi:hypothetical protein
MAVSAPDPAGTESLRNALLRLADNQPGQERWPLIRLGERKYISRYVRWAIFQRDGKRCLSCGTPLTITEAQLDHIVPWSAGGSDRSDNLRLLCESCNTERSNFHGVLDTWAARRPPIALCCTGCVNDDDEYGDEFDEPISGRPEMVTAFCAHCGLVSRTWPEEVW